MKVRVSVKLVSQSRSRMAHEMCLQVGLYFFWSNGLYFGFKRLAHQRRANSRRKKVAAAEGQESDEGLLFACFFFSIFFEWAYGKLDGRGRGGRAVGRGEEMRKRELEEEEKVESVAV